MTRKEDEAIWKRARERFQLCVDWEANARRNYETDTKFSYGDSINNYQWDNDVRNSRINDSMGAKPCLTINKTQQHCLQIINDAKQNKPGVNVRPVGDGASYDAAQVYQNIIRHIEYISNAEQVYDTATVTQVRGGIGYWRVVTDYLSDKDFNQEIYIRPINDPRAVYLDVNTKEADASDANYGFIFEDMERKLFDKENPDHTDAAQMPSLPTSGNFDVNWLDRDKIRICEYYEKSQKRDRLVSFVDPVSGERVTELYSDLTDEGKELFRAANDKQERVVMRDNVNWYKIAGDEIIDRREWPGKYIPIVRIIGTEIVIDGVMDRFGHTRALLDPQRMYNIASSNSVEFAALQTKVPYIGPVEAFQGQEELWGTANTRNHSFLPYNHIGEDGQPIPAPQKIPPPAQSVAYIKGMEIAQNEMMMASGQYQSQLGENENAKSGVAINARQRQGDRATYHFIDNLAIGIKHTGKILLDLIPKIYDTERALRCQAIDGTILEIAIDPNAPEAAQKLQETVDKGIKTIQMAFNPSVGVYDVQSDTGPGYATRRQEAFNAMMQLAAQNKDFMHIAGDLFLRSADFPMANELAERYAKVVPPNLTGQAPPPELEQAMHMASDKIEAMQGIIQDLTEKLKDKDRDIDIRSYGEETKRLTAVGNLPPAIPFEMIRDIVMQTLQAAAMNPTPNPAEGAVEMPDVGAMGQQPPMPEAIPQQPMEQAPLQ